MSGTASRNPHIIGLTGSFGSGCTYVAREILLRNGYRFLSLSDTLREEYSKSGRGQGDEASRHDLQAFGDELRGEHGGQYLATRVCEQISSEFDATSSQKWVLDSIRNPHEVHFLRQFSADFFLFGVYATKDRRWQRSHPMYEGNQREFDEDDERDTGRRSEPVGQRVEDCFVEADVVFSNDKQFEVVGNESFGAFKRKVEGYVDLCCNPLSRRQPTIAESLMAVAYALSQRSSCLQRKVGAVIVDEEGNVISSGFNEVPREDRPCVEVYRKCRRRKDWERFQNLLQETLPESRENHQKFLERVRREFRMLDHCRALHAEENAIVNLARYGRSVSLDKCELYCTTYPCRLCANKIVNLGISRVVYCEPYPDEESKAILKAGNVDDDFFEGITFKAYSRIYGERK